jgi:hypothetical protein
MREPPSLRKVSISLGWELELELGFE